jgi:cytochrome c peroxidase
VIAVAACGMGGLAHAQHRIPNNQVPPPLAAIPVPGIATDGLPALIEGRRTTTGTGIVKDRQAAIALGKALFWDMQVGSDGGTACASCHFHAGTDPRSKHQIFPRIGSFGRVGLNGQLTRADFPLTRFAQHWNRESTRTSWDAAIGSQGVFLEQFLGASPGRSTDLRSISATRTPFHDAAGVPHTQVTGRNAPSVINAVYNFRQFWDGRANYVFNGESAFGNRDPNARVTWVRSDGHAENVRIAVSGASLASQAVGPVTNDVEMSASGRQFADVGRRLLAARPLRFQRVDPNDSVLGSRVSSTGSGLEGTYQSMIEAAFDPGWFTDTRLARVTFGPDGRRLVRPADPAFANAYTVPEANFALFFGLALQLYQATLVSDQTPFDRHLEGMPNQLDASALRGMSLFYGGKAKCSNCHGGPEFTNASIRNVLNNGPLHRMVMGNNQFAVYDEGFYNIGVRPTAADIGNGGKAEGSPTSPQLGHLPRLAGAGGQTSGMPLSSSEISRLYDATVFERLVGVSPGGIKVGAHERTAVNGAFKTPGLRNVALTAPYFHNGDALTLRQVVEFYNRGGNFHRENEADLDADILPLGLTNAEMNDLVRFLESLTDNRVWRRSAPFDHPQLFVKVGHGDSVITSRNGTFREVAYQEIPSVGAAGLTPDRIPAEFLGNLMSGEEKRFSLEAPVPVHPIGGVTYGPACLTVWPTSAPRKGGAHSFLSIEPCSAALAEQQSFVARNAHRAPVPSATFMLYNDKSGKYLALRNGAVTMVPVQELRAGDVVRVEDRAGRSLPVFNESGFCLQRGFSDGIRSYERDSVGVPSPCHRMSLLVRRQPAP